MTDTEPEFVDLPCSEPGCGFTTGPMHATGRNNAGWKLGAHMYGKHKIKSAPGSSTRARKGRRTPTAEEFETRPALSIVRDALGEIDTGTGAPTADALARTGGKALNTTTSMAALWAIESDPMCQGMADEDKRTMAAGLRVKLDTGTDICQPLGRLIAPTRVNKRYGRAAVENVDVLVSFGELIAIGARWSSYLRARRQYAAELRGAAPAQIGYAAPQAEAYIAPASVPPPPAPAPPPTEYVPMATASASGIPAGTVMTPELAAQLIRQRQRG